MIFKPFFNRKNGILELPKVDLFDFLKTNKSFVVLLNECKLYLYLIGNN